MMQPPQDTAPEPSGQELREATFWDAKNRAISEAKLQETVHPETNPIDRCVVDLLGPVGGRDILDLGCGHGMWSAFLAEQGARVVAFDISKEQVRAARRRAQARGVPDRFHPAVASATALPFADASFDLVQGQDIIHHIADTGLLGREIARVLRPGGRAVFRENSANNPLLMLARKFCGHFGIPKWSSPDEYPLTRRKVKEFAQAFGELAVVYPRFQFFFYFDAKFFDGRNRAVTRICTTLDSIIYDRLPPLRQYSYRQVIACCRTAGCFERLAKEAPHDGRGQATGSSGAR